MQFGFLSQMIVAIVIHNNIKHLFMLHVCELFQGQFFEVNNQSELGNCSNRLSHYSTRCPCKNLAKLI